MQVYMFLENVWASIGFRVRSALGSNITITFADLWLNITHFSYRLICRSGNL